MGFKCSIIGLPNVGKSTLFNTLTKSKIKADNFPFCTIKTNKGIIAVPDQRLKKISEIVKPKRTIPTFIEFVDVAGLVQGASKGEGLGNQFLSHIRETEAIIHVVRCFEDNNIIHVSGVVNPVKDIDIIHTELTLYDIDICNKTIDRIYQKKNHDSKVKILLYLLEKCLSQLEAIGTLRSLRLKEEEKQFIHHLNFLTRKPMIYIANVNTDSLQNNLYFNQVKTIAEQQHTISIPLCVLLEECFTNVNNKEHSYLMTTQLNSKLSNLDYVIHAAYKLLNLETYFTTGLQEVRAWSIPIGTTALQAAGKIHTDFKRGFIRAKVISYEDFIIYKGEKGAKKAGKIRFEGKNYTVQDGDILNFLFNV